MAPSPPVGTLKNIGVTLSARLAEIGVHTRADLEQVGPATAYQHLNAKAGKKLPVCYNLYSLEAALRDMDWRDLSDEEKLALREGGSG